MKKAFVFDTNVFLENPNVFDSFKEELKIIPLTVIEELDKLKTRMDLVGYKARKATHVIDDHVESGDETLIFDSSGKDLEVNDDKILDVAKKYNKKYEVTLLTNDLNLKIKAKVFKLKTLPYQKENYSIDDDSFRGYTTRYVPKSIIEALYNGESIDPQLIGDNLFPNEYLILKEESNKKQTVLAKYVPHKEHKIRFVENDPEFYKSFSRIKPKNIEQLFALDALFDPDVSLVSLVGMAGTGKTLLAMAAGIHQHFGHNSTDKRFRKIIVSRPIQPLGKDIGFLPGSLEEKLEPWLAPIRDNLYTIAGGNKNMVDGWFENGDIEIEAITYIRGRSISNAFIVIDESQNLTSHEIKTILTRVGENTKIILTGDVEQIDNPELSHISNGLTYCINKFKPYDLSSHIVLTKGERSRLASLAAEIL